MSDQRSAVTTAVHVMETATAHLNEAIGLAVQGAQLEGVVATRFFAACQEVIDAFSAGHAIYAAALAEVHEHQELLYAENAELRQLVNDLHAMMQKQQQEPSAN